MALGTRGPLTTECTACAASGMSLGNATMYIRAGMADAMLAGGVEAPIVPLALGGFGTHAGAVAAPRRSRGRQPAVRLRPRRVHPLGGRGRRGAGGARSGPARRGARIYAEVLGYGMSSDAHHVTEPDPVGTNPARAMTMAMDDAGVTPDQIGYVNAHGTSTPAGDSAETRALKLALGRRARGPDTRLVDQERDRPPARRDRRGRGGGDRARDARRVPAADDQPDRPRPRVRPRLHPERRPRGGRAGGGVQLVRLRRAQCGARAARWDAGD